jgi:hypothetical protein
LGTGDIPGKGASSALVVWYAPSLNDSPVSLLTLFFCPSASGFGWCYRAVIVLPDAFAKSSNRSSAIPHRKCSAALR